MSPNPRHHRLLTRVLLVVIVGLFFLHSVQPARILSVAFVSSKSHKITYEPLLYELGARGHDVTVLAPYISGKTIKNVREIQTIDVEESFKTMPNAFEMKERGEDMSFAVVAKFFSEICANTYDLPQVKAIAKEKFDLIILQPMFNECTAAWVHAFNTSLVLVVPAMAPSWITSHFGNPSPISFIPNFMSGFLSDEMNFFQRVKNFVMEVAMGGMLYFAYQPTMDGVFKDKMPNSPIQSSDELFQNASLILTNSHFSLSNPRPYLPDVIEVGGMHCRPAKPLPKDLDDYLNSSGPDGFIYFSMGSALKGSMMPEAKRKMFLSVFSKLKQKVLWKWETEKMDDLPPNVKLSKWLPQQDVLGHPKIRAFITHGGFGGTTESIYHGVPLIGIPMFGDQQMNMLKAKHAGYAVNLDYLSLTEEELTAAIQEILNNPQYKERVKELSTRFRDQPDKPLDRAVFWTEYVIRHKGAPHLRSAARNLNFIQYHSIDVVATLLAALGAVLFVIYAILRWVARKLCGGGGGAKAKHGGKGKKDN